MTKEPVYKTDYKICIKCKAFKHIDRDIDDEQNHDELLSYISRCENPKSDHYGHLLWDEHPACKEVAEV